MTEFLRTPGALTLVAIQKCRQLADSRKNWRVAGRCCLTVGLLAVVPSSST
jgi:hypothetical protein